MKLATTIITLLTLTATAMFSSALYFILSDTLLVINWTICHIHTLPLLLSIIIDYQGLLLSSVVLLITASVLGFSETYMAQDPFMPRFKAILLLFVLSMNLLIFIPNMAALMVGWDGLGLTSFLLVIYYSNPKSLSAGMLTALTNRLGDAALLTAAALLMCNNHWTINTLWPTESPLIIITIVLAACTKSAQMPFSSWLPAAMAAPTPVSALVHSSTLVTAGVFLLLRFYPTLANLKLFHITLGLTACLTMVMSGLAALTETDLKKIIALSTLSQLGVMVGSIAIALPQIALFHLVTHALFKALLFLCAGTFIHFNLHTQDLRMSGMFYKLPITSSCFIIASLALGGMPFLSAFYSKDLILEYTLQSPSNLLLTIFFFIATFLTTSYTTRLVMCVLSAPASFQPLNSLNEDEMASTLPLITLAIAAATGGALLNWVLIEPIESPPLPIMLKQLPLWIAWAGSFLTPALITVNPPKPMSPHISLLPHSFNSSMWFLSPLSTQVSLNPPLTLGFRLLHTVDQGWQETLGGQGAFLISHKTGLTLSSMANNPATVALITAMSLMPLYLML